MQRILVIDDNPAVTRLLKRGLFDEGFSVILAGSGEAGLTLARDYPPDLVILDIVLPGIDGLEVLHRLHAADPQLPILILTAKDAPADQVLGLESGADDYVVKPFIFTVLLARVRALLRRQHAEYPSVLTFTDLTLDRSSRQVRRGQREIVLTSLEFKLLQTFLEHASNCSPRTRCSAWSGVRTSAGVETWWRSTSSSCGRRVEGGGEPRLLHTIRGAGYILREAQAARPADAQDNPQLSSANPQRSLKSPTGSRGTIPSRQ